MNKFASRPMDNRARKNDRLIGKCPISNWRRAKLTVFARDPRLFHYASLLLRQTARGSVSQERARELLSARTALPFRIAHVAAAVDV